MTASDGTWRLTALIRVTVALFALASAHAQTVGVGLCPTYQTTSGFAQQDIDKVTAHEDGYSLVLTNNRPSTRECQRLKLFSNGTFFFSFIDDYNEPRNFSGPYTAKTSTFTDAGYIDLNLPPTVMGADMFGNLRLYVLVIQDSYLVLASCINVGLLRIEYVQVFVPTSQFNTVNIQSLNTTLIGLGIPHVENLNEVKQLCDASLRLVTLIPKVILFLIKIGIISPVNTTGTAFIRNSPSFRFDDLALGAAPTILNYDHSAASPNVPFVNPSIIRNSPSISPIHYPYNGPGIIRYSPSQFPEVYSSNVPGIASYGLPGYSFANPHADQRIIRFDPSASSIAYPYINPGIANIGASESPTINPHSAVYSPLDYQGYSIPNSVYQSSAFYDTMSSPFYNTVTRPIYDIVSPTTHAYSAEPYFVKNQMQTLNYNEFAPAVAEDSKIRNRFYKH